ncbi:acyltransferase family protein [Allosphingosinicella deserti]|uniref:Acyltransferase n=1 Tax=Allosphingosinicella deserti TaxID=2116704 RepID=A0A2P7QNZ6_9SPHN|nr:acyltransferase family protein [Sphingomonas deserti]PSJ39670.1 hypothetical protein C7I55_13840 [Sphingomonas deserti]
MLSTNQAAQTADRATRIPAIEGLRAIAVLAVIVYHLRPALLPGGYAGVDIFFVISGFVVTGALARRPPDRLAHALGAFYARRILRLLPALLVMLVTAVLASLLFAPMITILTDSRAVALGATVGGANIVLARTGLGYFGASADLHPFVHTWSLGVEEQFYLVCPILIWLWARGGRDVDRRRIVLALIGVTATSLAACFLLRLSAPKAAFYLMPTRFWELGFGVILALTSDHWQPRLAAVRPAARSALILFGTACLLAVMLLPGGEGWLRSGIVAGVSAAVIAAIASADAGLSSNRILGSAAAVWIGERSYSLYLWHWPVFVLFRWTIGLEGVAAPLLSLALTLVTGMLSYTVVERPFRRIRHVAAETPGRVIAAGLTAILFSAGTILLLFSQASALTLSRMDPAKLYGGPSPSRCAVRRDEQSFHGGAVRTVSPLCSEEGLGVRLFVVGDSHARSYLSLAEQYSARKRVAAAIYDRSGCSFPPVIWDARDTTRCRQFRKNVAQELDRTLRRGDILFMPGLRIRRLARGQGQAAQIPIRPGSAFRKNETEILVFLRRMANRGVILVFEAPKPVLPSIPYRCSDWFNRSNPICRGGLEIDRAAIERMRAPVIDEMQRLAGAMPNVVLFDPLPILCPGIRCGARLGERTLYGDGDHVTDEANQLLYPAFVRAIEGARSRPKANWVSQADQGQTR